jgi:hypothetical protein
MIAGQPLYAAACKGVELLLFRADRRVLIASGSAYALRTQSSPSALRASSASFTSPVSDLQTIASQRMCHGGG